MNSFERFLTFADTKQVATEGFYYTFTSSEIEIMADDSLLTIIIDFEDKVHIEYTEYEGVDPVVEAKTTLSLNTAKASDIINWITGNKR